MKEKIWFLFTYFLAILKIVVSSAFALLLLVFASIGQWCYVIYFYKKFVEMGLALEAAFINDLADIFVGLNQQFAGKA